MKTLGWLLIGTLALALEARAEVPPVAVRVPETSAWSGQRLSFFVDLRATGPFAGTANFDLPQLPGVLVLKIGSPVVSSEAIEGQTWMVQTHEFALFSQKSGPLAMPPFAVRFSSREGYTGPTHETTAQIPGWNAEIRRPPGTEQLGFLLTTESLDVSETWEPEPGSVRVGAILKRTIVQRASGIPGMALTPVPTAVPKGVHVYSGTIEAPDQSERGDLVGERRETLTYLLQEPGHFTLPALSFTWWNPTTLQIQSTTLPAVNFEVAAPPMSWSDLCRGGPWLLALAAAGGLAAGQRRKVAQWATQTWKKLDPPDRVAARKLLRACRRNDAPAAESAWMVWRNTQGRGFEPDPALAAAILELQARLFRPASVGAWRGAALARDFRNQLGAAATRGLPKGMAILPPLNP